MAGSPQVFSAGPTEAAGHVALVGGHDLVVELIFGDHFFVFVVPALEATQLAAALSQVGFHAFTLGGFAVGVEAVAQSHQWAPSSSRTAGAVLVTEGVSSVGGAGGSGCPSGVRRSSDTSSSLGMRSVMSRRRCAVWWAIRSAAVSGT